MVEGKHVGQNWGDGLGSVDLRSAGRCVFLSDALCFINITWTFFVLAAAGKMQIVTENHRRTNEHTFIPAAMDGGKLPVLSPNEKIKLGDLSVEDLQRFQNLITRASSL